MRLRPLELPGHGFREAEPLPYAPGSASDLARWHEGSAEADGAMPSFAGLCAGRDAEVRALCDAIEPLLDKPFAIFGFSNGALLGYLMVIELQRRGAPPPLRLMCACRGAPHTVRIRVDELTALMRLDDAATIEWAEQSGVLARKEVRRTEVSARFAPTTRSDMPLGILEAGTRVAEPPCNQLQSAPGTEARAANPPRLTSCPLTVLLGDEDAMWPSEVYGAHWLEVAGEAEGSLRHVTVRGAAHHQLQCWPRMREAAFAEVADGLALRASGPARETGRAE